MELLKGHEGKKTKINVNGHEVDALVSIRYDVETDIDFSFWESETTKQAKHDLAKGTMECVYVQVSVTAEGLEGMDSIGQTFVRVLAFSNDVLETVNTYSMVDNAKQDLVNQILSSAHNFQKYLVKVV